MWSIIDFIGEIGGTIPWLYRGWFWLLSSKYRSQMKEEYKNDSIFVIIVSIFLCIIFMLAEVVLFVDVIGYINW